MAYRYQKEFNSNMQKLADVNLPETFKKSFVGELTYMQALKHEAMIEETHRNGKKARENHATADGRLNFLLGMLDTLRCLNMLTPETDKKLVDLAYRTNRLYEMC